MATIENTSLPPSVKLAHTVNSRGELGMFVNPYACDCGGCQTYLAGLPAKKSAVVEHPATLPTPTPVSLTTVPPLLTPPYSVLESSVVDILAQMGAAQGNTGLTRSVTGFHYVEEDDTGLGPTTSINPYFADIWNVGTAAQAKTYTVSLTGQQKAVVKEALEERIRTFTQEQEALDDHTGCRSHDEMAAQDVEWEILDRKIAEIDDILSILVLEDD